MGSRSVTAQHNTGGQPAMPAHPHPHLEALVRVQQQAAIAAVAHVRQLRLERFPAVLQLGLPGIKRPLQVCQHGPAGLCQRLRPLGLVGSTLSSRLLLGSLCHQRLPLGQVAGMPAAGAAMQRDTSC